MDVMRVQHFRRTTFTNTSFLVSLLVLAILWFIIAFGFWWKLVYTNPERIFWDAIANNFSTSGFSRLTSYQDQEASELSASQIQYGQRNIAETHITVNAPGMKQKAEVISTPEEDYLRYVQFSSDDEGSGKSKALGVWAKSDGSGDLRQSFGQLTLLLSLFPMGYVPADERDDLVNYAKSNSVYNPEVDTVIKETIDGRSVYTFKVTVQLQTYADMLQQFAQATGQADAAADISPADYADVAPIPLEVSIDPLSRRIVRVMNPGDDTTVEAYRGYGISSKVVEVPQKYLSTSELQELLQQN